MTDGQLPGDTTPVSTVVREHDLLQLDDGRRLAVCEVGDPDGDVAFYLHGTGSSRLEVALYAATATRHGIRLVAWDRPGSGGSDDLPNRTLLDVVPDAAAVAGKVGADRPVVVGLSGGGSHVLALVSAGSGVVRAGVAINPGAPADDRVLADMPRQNRVMIKLARDHPRMFRRLIAPMESGGGKLMQKMQRRALDPLDVQTVEDPDVGPLFAASAAEGRRQAGAYLNEALMIWSGRWPVDLTTFPVPLHVYAGENDPFATFSRSLERSGAVLHMFPGGHVSGFAPDVLERVMTTVAAL